MPLRAFFVFPLVNFSISGTSFGQFQCPYGHSLFFHGRMGKKLVRRGFVSMPLRAFFVFPPIFR